MVIKELFNVERMKFINKHFEFIELEDLNDNHILLDLRTKKEYDYRHLKDSKHINLMDDDKAIKLEGMFENKTYFKTSIKSLLYIIPNITRVRREISMYEKKNIVVLTCRHARIRSRCIAMYVNLLGSSVLVLNGGVNDRLNINKKEVLNLK